MLGLKVVQCNLLFIDKQTSDDCVLILLTAYPLGMKTLENALICQWQIHILALIHQGALFN